MFWQESGNGTLSFPVFVDQVNFLASVLIARFSLGHVFIEKTMLSYVSVENIFINIFIGQYLAQTRKDFKRIY